MGGGISGRGGAAGGDRRRRAARDGEGEDRGRCGGGESASGHAIAMADQSGARRVLALHHDPSHDDDCLDRLLAVAVADAT